MQMHRRLILEALAFEGAREQLAAQTALFQLEWAAGVRRVRAARRALELEVEAAAQLLHPGETAAQRWERLALEAGSLV